MAQPRLTFRVHAIQRMFQREISAEDARGVVESGETIEQYPDDQPYPSRLVLGWSGEKPLHVVVADNDEDSEIIVITVYVPDQEQWEPDFRSRR